MSADQYFHIVFPQDVLLHFPAIHHLEALGIVVALRLWEHLAWFANHGSLRQPFCCYVYELWACF